MRINQFLAKAGVSSRRSADAIISAGRVHVNGKKCTELGTKIDVTKDKVELDGRHLKLESQKVVYILNKPKGVVTTSDDPEGRKTVLEFVPNEPRVYACGRLDFASMGLVVLTNDGDLCYQLTHPKFENQKEYLAEVTGRDVDGSITRLQEGVHLEDGFIKPDSLKIAKQTPKKTHLLITIHDGRNRVIRRMCDKVGLELLNLTRIQMGKYKLGDLPVGKYKVVS